MPPLELVHHPADPNEHEGLHVHNQYKSSALVASPVSAYAEMTSFWTKHSTEETSAHLNCVHPIERRRGPT
jgi:hypothetical protein